ncbi:MAG: hypothetical protein JST19_16005, partial [Bacteroidetes bacterium]|nr:hypothetical protein [Bacteroidota bacterium]
MKEMNDDELQRLFEEGTPNSEPTSDDARAYQTLFEALKSEPEKGLPYDFAANVTRQIQAEQKHSSEIKSNVIAAGLFLAAMVVLCCLFAFLKPDTKSTLLEYKWVLLLLPLAFIAIQ